MISPSIQLSAEDPQFASETCLLGKPAGFSLEMVLFTETWFYLCKKYLMSLSPFWRKVADAALSRAIPLVVDDSELKGNAKSAASLFLVPIEQEDFVFLPR